MAAQAGQLSCCFAFLAGLGLPCALPSGFGEGRPLSPKQWEAVRSLERLAFSTLTYKLDPALMGRAASNAEDHNKILTALGCVVATFEGGAGYFTTSGGGWPSAFVLAPNFSPSWLPDSSAGSKDAPARFGHQLGDLTFPAFRLAKSIQADRLRFPVPPSLILGLTWVRALI